MRQRYKDIVVFVGLLLMKRKKKAFHFRPPPQLTHMLPRVPAKQSWSLMYEMVKNYDEAVAKLETGCLTVTSPETKEFLRRKLEELQQRIAYDEQQRAEDSPAQSPSQDEEEDAQR